MHSEEDTMPGVSIKIYGTTLMDHAIKEWHNKFINFLFYD